MDKPRELQQQSFLAKSRELQQSHNGFGCAFNDEIPWQNPKAFYKCCSFT